MKGSANETLNRGKYLWYRNPCMSFTDTNGPHLNSSTNRGRKSSQVRRIHWRHGADRFCFVFVFCSFWA